MLIDDWPFYLRIPLSIILFIVLCILFPIFILMIMIVGIFGPPTSIRETVDLFEDLFITIYSYPFLLLMNK